jgi:hypothetical protein
MRVPETPPFEAHSGGVLVLANDTLLVPGPIAGAGLPGLIFVLADDSGDGFSLRGRSRRGVGRKILENYSLW